MDRRLFRLRQLLSSALVSALVVVFPSAARPQSPVWSESYARGVIASESSFASYVGLATLMKGGNAVDAAVATAFALAVTHPTAGNIGGGGFMVVRLADGSATTFDFRETAPNRAHDHMFLNAAGVYDPQRHHWSILSVGVPGSVAGLVLAHERLGVLPWRDLVEPAVRLARDGFVIPQSLAASLRSVLPELTKYEASKAQFTKNGAPYRAGELLVQLDLAKTLERIRDHGAAGFYGGETARLIVEEMERRGGMISKEDLASYRAVEREPLRGSYRGYDVLAMGPPSSGGIALVQMLNILEHDDLASLGLRSAAATHLVVEAMRRAFADRARYVADPDFVDVPISRLTSKKYAQTLRRSISAAQASVSSPEAFTWPQEGTETTHLSVVDSQRMAVALTTTLERSYGCRIVVPGAGFLLNNEMGDFNPVPGETTASGRIGTAANTVAPRKRMLSSMSPTILAKDGHLQLAVGSPGGRTIINSVLLVILNRVDYGMSLQEAVDAPRFHHQWLPDKIVGERWCFSRDTWQALEAMGHQLTVRRGGQGSVMAIGTHHDAAAGRDVLHAGVDRRRGGGAAGY